MNDGELRFESIKESRGWYIAEYAPPICNHPFATIQLTILNDQDAADLARVASTMEHEIAVWLKRYSVPVMVSSFNASGYLICLQPEKPSDHLMGRKLETGAIELVWRLMDSRSLSVYSPEELRRIYHDIPFRTGEQIRAEAEASLKTSKTAIRWGIALLILWLVVIPVGIAIMGFTNPMIGTIVLIYALGKGFVQLMKLLGKWSESASEKLKTDKKRRMEHYFWHCEKNPEGFHRLNTENFDREERERTLQESVELEKP